MAVGMNCYGLTDPGRVRPVNEDQFLIADLQRSMLVSQTSLSHEDRTRLFGRAVGHLLVVADGLGGMGSGDRASRIAVATLTRYVLNTMRWFFRLSEDSQEALVEELGAALQACQERIDVVIGEHPEAEGMGTTLTMAYVLWPRLFVVHAGDSRCYLHRDGRLRQVTTDHTVAQQLLKEGRLDRAEAGRWNDILWNAIGGGTSEVRPEVYRAELQVGDVLLLCTDGLPKEVPDASIARLLATEAPPEEICRRLVAEANGAGGSDNITVVVARAEKPGVEPTGPPEEAGATADLAGSAPGFATAG